MKRFLRALVLGLFLLAGSSDAIAEVKTFQPGSYIIRMGIVPQTIGNGLKPYGLVYELVKTRQIPIYWAFDTAKLKDGVDFSHEGIEYRGGPFIISAQDTGKAGVKTSIANWQALGVQLQMITTPLTVNIPQTFTFVPQWVLDAQNGSLAIPNFTNAGIPASAYTFKDPNLLNVCDDIFVMPHADPTWAIHKRLYYWNSSDPLIGGKGSIWAGCHAPSVLEDVFNPSIPAERMNFLSTNGLVDFGDHEDGSPPYQHISPGNPAFQYLGITDPAQLNGSEQIYLPKLTSAWRATTMFGTVDSTHADVPSLSPGIAAVNLYGRAFGDNTRGLVMYEAGHRINGGTTPENVAAMRIFFNWAYLAMQDKQPKLTYGGVPPVLVSNTPYTITANVQGFSPPYTYLWVSTCGGTFTPNNAATTSYTPPVTLTPRPCVVQCFVSDACGRANFGLPTVDPELVPEPTAPNAVNDVAGITVGCGDVSAGVIINVLANDFDINYDRMTVTAVSGSNGTWTTNGTTVTFVPNEGFFGIANGNYTVCDTTKPTALCSNATITVGVGSPDAKGCYPGSVWGVNNENGITAITTANGWENAIDDVSDNSDYDPTDVTTYITSPNNINPGTLDFGAIKTTAAFDVITVFMSTNTAGSRVRLLLSYSPSHNPAGPYTNIGNVTSGTDPNVLTVKSFALPADVRYIRVSRDSGTALIRLDAVTVQDSSCVPAALVASNDVVQVLEDNPTRINPTANDINPGNLPLRLTVLSPPKHGSYGINSDLSITYVSSFDYSGLDTIQYRICNTQDFCSNAKIFISVKDDLCAAGSY